MEEPQYIDASQVFEVKNATLIDVRDHDYKEIGHVFGSINIPIGEVTEERLKEAVHTDTVLVYCKSSKQRATNAYHLAKAALPGKQVLVVRGGIIEIARLHPDKIESD